MCDTGVTTRVNAPQRSIDDGLLRKEQANRRRALRWRTNGAAWARYAAYSAPGRLQSSARCAAACRVHRGGSEFVKMPDSAGCGTIVQRPAPLLQWQRAAFRARIPRMALTLFPFRYRDAATGKWVRARYKATVEEIAQRHAQWEITGPAESRSGNAAMFRPHYRIVAHAELKRLEDAAPVLDPHRASPPAIDPLEADLVRTFLRRYVRYCARTRRYAAMQGAARLYAELPPAPLHPAPAP